RRPDRPWLLQTYVWQDYDLCPMFPVLNKFLNFWLEKLEGPLHSITVAHSRLIKPAEIRAGDGGLRLHYDPLLLERESGPSSLRAKRSNPGAQACAALDRFVAIAR